MGGKWFLRFCTTLEKREHTLCHILFNFYIQKESTLHVKDYLTALAIPSFSGRISNLYLFNMNNRRPKMRGEILLAEGFLLDLDFLNMGPNTDMSSMYLLFLDANFNTINCKPCNYNSISRI